MGISQNLYMHLAQALTIDVYITKKVENTDHNEVSYRHQ